MATAKKSPLPVNPDILVWARERRDFSIEEAAAKINVKPERVAQWEVGESAPTARQGRMLAKLYDRPFLEFFASEKPVIPETELVPDYRFYARGPSVTERQTLKGIQHWAEEQRLNALALIEEIGEAPPIFSGNLRFSIADDVEEAAKVVREAMRFPIEDQIGLRSSQRAQLPNILRGKIEGMGVLVLKQGGLTKLRARGICLYAEPLPVIVFGNEAPSAQAFTLAHEFGHILLGSSAISGGPRFGSSGLTGGKAVESWCNRFAASFLAPSDALEQYKLPPERPDDDFDLNELNWLAGVFAMSRHAMLIRLVNLGYVKPAFYWLRMRPIFLAEEANYRSFGRPPYYGKRYVNSRGLFYTGLVLDAWSSGRITGHNAAEYMGIKNLAHLQDIRSDFRV